MVRARYARAIITPKSWCRGCATLIAFGLSGGNRSGVRARTAVAIIIPKPTCWCAQEEIYHLAVQLRAGLKEKIHNTGILSRFAPPCMARGLCQEGVRFCGRDLKTKEDYFPKRKI